MLKLPKFSEVGWMRFVACVAIIWLTALLAALNVSGAWIGSHGNIAFTGTILGAEILAATCLVLILSAPTWPRKIVGSIVFAVLVWVCIENGKISVERSFADVFVGNASALDKKAVVAQTAADTLKTSTKEDQNTLKEERAKLLVEQELMAAPASDTKAVRLAQTRLKALGLYVRQIDGIQGEDTQASMLSRGRVISDRLAELKTMITDETGGQSAAEKKEGEAIDLATQADEVRNAALWMIMLLIGLEGARSFGLWCYVIWDTKYKAAAKTVAVDPDVFRDLQRDADELARRKANIGEGVDKALKTKTRKRNRDVSIQMLEDQRAESVKREADERQKIDDAIAEMSAEPAEEEEVPDLLDPETPEEAEPEAPAESPAVEETNANSDASEPAAEGPDETTGRAAA